MSTALTIHRGNDAPATYAETLRPNSFDALVKFAERMARTSFAPKAFQGKPDEIVAAVMFGAEIGLAPLQALQNISVVNGRPAVWGDAALAVCQAHPAFEWIKETHEGDGDSRTAVCEVKRKGMDAHTSRFGVADAKRASLWGKDTYKSYPDRMLQMRARGFALRNTFADALKGMVTREEAEDYEPVRAEQIDQPTPAPRQSVTAAAREKLRAKAPVHGGVLLEISGAADEAALKAAAEKAKSLPAEEQEAARIAYKARAKDLREEAWRRKQAESQDAGPQESLADAIRASDEAKREEMDPDTGEIREPGSDG